MQSSVATLHAAVRGWGDRVGVREGIEGGCFRRRHHHASIVPRTNRKPRKHKPTTIPRDYSRGEVVKATKMENQVYEENLRRSMLMTVTHKGRV